MQIILWFCAFKGLGLASSFWKIKVSTFFSVEKSEERAQKVKVCASKVQIIMVAIWEVQ